MEKNSKLKILNIMSGANSGGAENFFERLTIAIEKEDLEQKVIIRHHQKRFDYLNTKLKNVKSIKLFNNFNPFCQSVIETSIKEFMPDIILTWMNRASRTLPNEKFGPEIVVGRLGGYYKMKNYSKCDYLIANTEDIKNYIIDSGWDSNKVTFIPNFVNPNKKTKLDLKFDKKKTLIAMGRFHENKGFDVLIKSLSFLPSYNLIIVGQGLLKDLYEELIEKYNLKERVKIFGWTDDISSFLNSASILVCPSRHEPFGNIIIDGWAHKIPVIAANVSGPSNLIKEKINGLKFEKEDIFNLVEKVEEIQKNKKLKDKIIKNAFAEYSKKFTQEIIVKKYISFFRKIIK